MNIELLFVCANTARKRVENWVNWAEPTMWNVKFYAARRQLDKEEKKKHTQNACFDYFPVQNLETSRASAMFSLVREGWKVLAGRRLRSDTNRRV